MKKCICCGMSMRSKADFPGEDESKDYCIYCAREDGSMKSFEEVVNGMTVYMADSEELDENDAKIKVIEYMKSMPAWKDNF